VSNSPIRQLDAALEYAARGWHLFPVHTARQTESGPRCSCGKGNCKHLGKHPRTKHGVNDATTDEPTIREWWRKCPDANIGIATGAKSGFVVLDIDPRHRGDASLAEWVKAHGELPETITVRTGGGGLHYYFNASGWSRVKNAAIAPGIDIKATGGYIVAPPSMHASGRPYEWREGWSPHEVALAEAPEWLLTRAKPPKKKSKVKREAGQLGRMGQLGQSVPPIPSGERNSTLFATACRLFRRGGDEASVLACVLEQNQKHCTPPLEESEVTEIVQNAAKYPVGPDCQYEFTPAGIFLKAGDKQICNFHARIVKQLIRDDGQTISRFFEVEAVVATGGVPARFVIAASRFRSSAWWVDYLGAHAFVHPGRAYEDHVRAAVQSVSSCCATEVEYTHTGWRVIDGEPYFLHAGGGIGAHGNRSDIRVRLEGSLAAFALPSAGQLTELREEFLAFAALSRLAPPGVMYPLILLPFAVVAGPTNYGVHIAGRTGAFKSQLAALIQSFFGRGFDSSTLPGSWVWTANALEVASFLLKDGVFVVDDFKPCGDFRHDSQLQEKADRVFRGQGNSAGRGRLDGDMQLQAARYPRGVILSTGEDTPEGQSLRARMLTLQLKSGDVDPSRLTKAQESAARGSFDSIMARYCAWIAAKRDSCQKLRQDRVAQLRFDLKGSHRRVASNLADLIAVSELLGEFLSEVYGGVCPEATDLARKLIEDTNRVAAGGIAEQAESLAEEDPVVLYLDNLRTALVTDQAHVCNLSGERPGVPGDGWTEGASGGWHPNGQRIGWYSDGELLLNPAVAFRVASSLLPRGKGFSIAEKTMRRRLADAGQLLRREAGRDSFLVRVSVEKRREPVLCLRPTAVGLPEGGGRS
jgi:hypothetical protein